MQRSRWTFDIMLACLVILVATFFVLTIYSILQANAAVLPEVFSLYLSFKILDSSSAATLFITLLGALLVRHQFAVELLPRINYTSSTAKRSDVASPDNSVETWRVEIINSGLGAAIVNSTVYSLKVLGEKTVNLTGNHQQIVSELAKIGLVRNTDYWLANLTAGFALAPKDDYVVFEIKKEHLSKLERLDMVLYFQSQLGGKYSREIYLLQQRVAETEER